MAKREDIAALREDYESVLRRIDSGKFGAPSIKGLTDMVREVIPTLRDYEALLEAVENFLEHSGHTEGCNYHMAFHDPFDCDCGHGDALTALRKAAAKEEE